MHGDSDVGPEPLPERDLWQLPQITSLDINRVHYSPPRVHTTGGRSVEHAEGVEILVETDGEIPVRALSPALHIGDAEIAENEQADKNAYRFFVFDERGLKPDAPIALGWVGHRALRVDSRFRYAPPPPA